MKLPTPETFEVHNIFEYKGMNTLVKCLTALAALTYGDPCILEAVARFILNSC